MTSKWHNITTVVTNAVVPMDMSESACMHRWDSTCVNSSALLLPKGLHQRHEGHVLVAFFNTS